MGVTPRAVHGTPRSSCTKSLWWRRSAHAKRMLATGTGSPDAQMRASPSPLVRVPTGCAGNKTFQSRGNSGADSTTHGRATGVHLSKWRIRPSAAWATAYGDAAPSRGANSAQPALKPHQHPVGQHAGQDCAKNAAAPQKVAAGDGRSTQLHPGGPQAGV